MHNTKIILPNSLTTEECLDYSIKESIESKIVELKEKYSPKYILFITDAQNINIYAENFFPLSDLAKKINFAKKFVYDFLGTIIILATEAEYDPEKTKIDFFWKNC